MFGKLIESVTALSGSYRVDASLLGFKIAKRCAVAYDLSSEEEFMSMGTQAFNMRQRVNDEVSCKSAECKLIRAALIELEKKAVLLEVKHNLRNRITEILKAAQMPRHFFIEGRDNGLTPQEYGKMAVDLSVPAAKSMLTAILAMPHDHDETSLIQFMGTDRGKRYAIVHLVVIAVAAHVAYVIECMGDVPSNMYPEIREGVEIGFKANGSYSDTIMSLFHTYLSAIITDIKLGGPIHALGSETHRAFIRLLARACSGRDDIDDLAGVDGPTLAPFTDRYYLEVIRIIRDNGKLSYR